MLGGVEMNGETIYTQAQEEQTLLEEQMVSLLDIPPIFLAG